MDHLAHIISQLERQKAAIERAISALGEIDSGPENKQTVSQTPEVGARKRRLSPEGRKRIAEAMRRRWAAKKAGQQGSKATAAKVSVAPRKPLRKRLISAAGRKRIAEAARRMWAARRAAALDKK